MLKELVALLWVGYLLQFSYSELVDRKCIFISYSTRGLHVFLRRQFSDCLVDGARHTPALRVCHLDTLQRATSLMTLVWECSPLLYHKVVNLMELSIDPKGAVHLIVLPHSTRCN